MNSLEKILLTYLDPTFLSDQLIQIYERLSGYSGVRHALLSQPKLPEKVVLSIINFNPCVSEFLSSPAITKKSLIVFIAGVWENLKVDSIREALYYPKSAALFMEHYTPKELYKILSWDKIFELAYRLVVGEDQHGDGPHRGSTSYINQLLVAFENSGSFDLKEALRGKNMDHFLPHPAVPDSYLRYFYDDKKYSYALSKNPNLSPQGLMIIFKDFNDEGQLELVNHPNANDDFYVRLHNATKYGSVKGAVKAKRPGLRGLV